MALVRMKAAAVNARDMMVIAHNPIYPGDHIEDLMLCAVGAGEVEGVGEGSIWKVGDRVLVLANSWVVDKEEMLTVPEVKTKGADKYQGTLREYAVWVSIHKYLTGGDGSVTIQYLCLLISHCK